MASLIIVDCMLMASLNACCWPPSLLADGLPHCMPRTQASSCVSSSQRPHATLPRRTLRGLRSPRSRTREICSPTPTMTILTGRASTARGRRSRRRCGAPRRRSTRPTGSSCSRMQVLTTAWSVGSLLSRGWSAMTSTCMPRSRRSAMTSTCMPRSRRSRNAAGLWRYYSTTTRSRAHLAPRWWQECLPHCMRIASLIACRLPPSLHALHAGGGRL